MIFLGCVKTGACLVAESVVTDDDGIRVLLFQFSQQVEHSLFLFGCPGVCRFAFVIKASLVTDTDGVAVVVQTMCTNHLLRSADFNIPIPADIVVVPRAVPALGDVPFRDLFNRTRL